MPTSRKRGCTAMPDLNALREKICREQPSRVAHMLGCEETAVQLAQRWGADEKTTRFAALLHDCTKQYSYEEQLKLAEKYGILIDDDFRRCPALLHALTAAAVARAEYDAPDDVVNAVRYHTTGRPGMSLLERIIYLADYMEPSRTFSGPDKVRAIAYDDLDAAVLLCTQQVLTHLMQTARRIHPDALKAYNYMVDHANTSTEKG